MKHSVVRSLLVGFHEGTLPSDEKKTVENHLALCSECRNYSENIARTFKILQSEGPAEVPTHYFSNLLPRIRLRIEERPHSFAWLSPAPWIYKFVAPVSSAMVVACLIGLFTLLRPLSLQSPLEELRKEASTFGTQDVADYLVESSELTHALEPPQKVMDIVVDPSLVSSRLEHQMFARTAEEYQPTSLITTDDASVDSLSDEEINQVIAQFDKLTTL